MEIDHPRDTQPHIYKQIVLDLMGLGMNLQNQ